MLVFRNQTSYNRFWEGRNHLTTVITSVRNLTRSFISSSYKISGPEPASLSTDRADTERTIRILIAILYATKNHLRSDWGFATIPATEYSISNGFASAKPEYSDMLPHLTSFEDRGLGLPLQLTCFVEQYIKRGEEREWFHAPQASQMQVQLNNLVDAYGKMETIRLTPIPIAHLYVPILPHSLVQVLKHQPRIHQKQVLALFGCVLPFAMVDEMSWWAVPLVAFVIFTLYGIEGIGGQLEDPFGYDKNDIKMDAIVEDIRVEVTEELEEWKRVGRQGGEMFIGKGNAVGRDFGARVVNFQVEAEAGAGV